MLPLLLHILFIDLSPDCHYIIHFEVNFIAFSFVNCVPVHLWMCFWSYSFIITYWGYFVKFGGLFLSTFLMFYFVLLYLAVIFEDFQSFFLLVHFVYFSLISITCYLGLYGNNLFKENTYTKSKVKSSVKLERMSLSQYWWNWRSVKFFGVDLGDV